ncbi:hypothetical protein WAB17_10250 [Parerythrobacter aurantius]|uniref:hypothetical protein n=1 Tax=Parerythrobacter aurantius TaxID=3127706 RepID=UPI00324AB800
MEVLAVALAGLAVVLAGLVRMWRYEGPSWFIAGLGLFGLAGAIGYTAESWFSLVGHYRGDGQVMIGYYLLGLAAWAAILVALMLSALVVTFRPKAGQPNLESENVE